jgi:hyperosmotically inducible protein
MRRSLSILFLAAALLATAGLTGCTSEEQIHAQETARNAQAQAERTVRRVTRRAERAVEQAPEKARDVLLVAKVKSALALSKRLEGAQIDVGVEDGVVTLRGTVRDRGQREAAREIAADVPGIRRVTSKLKITSE